MRLPPAPSFTVNFRRQRSGASGAQPSSSSTTHNGTNIQIDIANDPSSSSAQQQRSGGDQPTTEEQRQIDMQVQQLTGAINRLLGNF